MKFIGKIFLSAFAYVAGLILSGMFGPLLHFPVLQAPAGMDPKRAFLMTIVCTPLLAAGFAPLALGIKGNWSKRWLAIGSLLWVAIGLNTVIELLIFSTMFKNGNAWLSVHWLLPCLLAGGVLAFCFGSNEGTSALRPRRAAEWLWRLALAWLSFPFVYYLFGMCVAPFVISAYHGGVSWLVIPAQSIIFRTQLLRSALFLAASLPAVVLWRKSRGQFIFAMGLAHAMAVGIFQLGQATFLPTVLRVAHSLEITADSFAYALVLGLLFVRTGTAEEKVEKSAAVAAS